MNTMDTWAGILVHGTITVFIARTIWLCVARPERIFKDGEKAYGLAKVMSATTYLAVSIAAVHAVWVQTGWISEMWLEIWPYSDGETAEILRLSIVLAAAVALWKVLDGYIEGLRVRAREALDRADRAASQDGRN